MTPFFFFSFDIAVQFGNSQTTHVPSKEHRRQNRVKKGRDVPEGHGQSLTLEEQPFTFH